MKKFCYRCGSLDGEEGPLINGLCQRCFSESPLLQAPNEVKVVVCRGCGAYRVGNSWQTCDSPDPVVAAVTQAVLEKVRVIRLTESGTQLLRPSEAGEVKISVEPNFKDNSARVTGIGKVHPLQVQPRSDEVIVKFKLSRIACKTCSLKSAKHFEAILQVRGEISEEVIARIMNKLENLAAETGAREPGDFIAEVEDQKGGVDLHLSTLSLARKMAALLKSKFGASLSESAKLIGQTRDGRKKYRVSILAKI